jgi:hypothetical protein
MILCFEHSVLYICSYSKTKPGVMEDRLMIIRLEFSCLTTTPSANPWSTNHHHDATSLRASATTIKTCIHVDKLEAVKPHRGSVPAHKWCNSAREDIGLFE